MLRTGNKIIWSAIIFTLLIIIGNNYFWHSSAGSAFTIISSAGNRLPDNQIKKVLFDLDQDNQKELIKLENDRITIFQDENLLWQSPVEWQVMDFIVADSMNDGQNKLNLIVWKPGNYGKSKPFWVKENDTTIKNHLFIMRKINDQIKPAWQSSNLSKPICSLAVRDINGDGLNELVVQEGEYGDGIYCLPLKQKVLRWNMWNFFTVD